MGSTRAAGAVSADASLTSADLSRFARMLLNGGSLDGVRVLSPLAVERMTQSSTPDGQRVRRGLGWDIDSAFSSNRGELLPLGSYGHTGFTGTSIWIDPERGTWVVLLANRTYEQGPNRMQALRRTLHDRVADSVRGGGYAAGSQ